MTSNITRTPTVQNVSDLQAINYTKVKEQGLGIGFLSAPISSGAVPDTIYGTAFLVTPDTVVTTAKFSKIPTLIFNYHDIENQGDKDSVKKLQEKNIYHIQTVLIEDPNWSLLKLDRPVEDRPVEDLPPLWLSPPHALNDKDLYVATGEDVYILGYSSKKELKYVSDLNITQLTDYTFLCGSRELWHNPEHTTFVGSPILRAASGNVVGIVSHAFTFVNGPVSGAGSGNVAGTGSNTLAECRRIDGWERLFEYANFRLYREVKTGFTFFSGLLSEMECQNLNCKPFWTAQGFGTFSKEIMASEKECLTCRKQGAKVTWLILKNCLFTITGCAERPQIKNLEKTGRAEDSIVRIGNDKFLRWKQLTLNVSDLKDQ